jgi:hypothetical protein
MCVPFLDVGVTLQAEFKTNKREQKAQSPPEKRVYDTEVDVKKGENLGFFHLGSSIVMVWEAPASLFMVCLLSSVANNQLPRGEYIKVGQPLTEEVTPEVAERQLERLRRQYTYDPIEQVYKVVSD